MGERVVVHYHAAQVLGHEIFIQFPLLFVRQRIVSVSFQNQDFPCSQSFYSVSKQLIISLYLAL